MDVPTPDWMTLHGCALKKSADGCSYAVYLNGDPQYLLIPVPARGKHACRVSQTVNGKRLDTGSTFPTRDAALSGGLNDLRQALGW